MWEFAEDDFEIVEQAADHGTIDIDQWSPLLERLLRRLEHIIHNEFPRVVYRPAVDPNHIPPVRPQDILPSQDSSDTSQATNKENAAPPSSPPVRPPVPPFPGTTTTDSSNNDKPSSSESAAAATTTTTSAVAETDEEEDLKDYINTLPPNLQLIIKSITTSLQTTFARSPPYTVQRFCELLIEPRLYYRHLPPYLNALDRVLSVSSTFDRFPLPMATVVSSSDDANPTTSLLNGATTTTATTTPSMSSMSLGSDESLGGALLTPILWLRADAQAKQPHEIRTESTQTIDGPNGTGSIETVTVSVNGVVSTFPAPSASQAEQQAAVVATTTPDPLLTSTTPATGVSQGELLRQEQEAGIIPLSQTQTQPGRQTRSATARSAAAAAVVAAAQREKDSGEEKGDGDSGDQKEGRGDAEVPHARGPEEVGVADMGPQDAGKLAAGGFDIEAATGRSLGGNAKAEGEKEGEDEMLADADPPAATTTEEGEGIKQDQEAKGGDDEDTTI